MHTLVPPLLSIWSLYGEGSKSWDDSLLLPVTWGCGARKGVFDFQIVDDLINQAREHNMKSASCGLVLGRMLSTYAPSWVKMDLERFKKAK